MNDKKEYKKPIVTYHGDLKVITKGGQDRVGDLAGKYGES